MATLDYEAPVAPAEADDAQTGGLAVYLLIGIYFGWVLIKGEMASWFRIQEMFRFQSFHMFGVIMSAIAVAALSVWLIRRFDVRDRHGRPVVVAPKSWGTGGTRYWAGGLIFGLGWALTGACPGPLFTLFGAGIPVILVPISAALAGAWVYGWARPRLPH